MEVSVERRTSVSDEDDGDEDDLMQLMPSSFSTLLGPSPCGVEGSRLEKLLFAHAMRIRSPVQQLKNYTRRRKSVPGSPDLQRSQKKSVANDVKENALPPVALGQRQRQPLRKGTGRVTRPLDIKFSKNLQEPVVVRDSHGLQDVAAFWVSEERKEAAEGARQGGNSRLLRVRSKQNARRRPTTKLDLVLPTESWDNEKLIVEEEPVLKASFKCSDYGGPDGRMLIESPAKASIDSPSLQKQQHTSLLFAPLVSQPSCSGQFSAGANRSPFVKTYEPGTSFESMPVDNAVNEYLRAQTEFMKSPALLFDDKTLGSPTPPANPLAHMQQPKRLNSENLSTAISAYNEARSKFMESPAFVLQPSIASPTPPPNPLLSLIDKNTLAEGNDEKMGVVVQRPDLAANVSPLANDPTKQTKDPEEVTLNTASPSPKGEIELEDEVSAGSADSTVVSSPFPAAVYSNRVLEVGQRRLAFIDMDVSPESNVEVGGSDMTICQMEHATVNPAEVSIVDVSERDGKDKCDQLQPDVFQGESNHNGSTPPQSSTEEAEQTDIQHTLDPKSSYKENGIAGDVSVVQEPTNCTREDELSNVAEEKSTDDIAKPVAKPRRRKAKRRPEVGESPFMQDAGMTWKDGTRRSTRIRSKPLEYWRGERLLYGRMHKTMVTLIGVKHSSPLPTWPKRGQDKPKTFKVDSFVPEQYEPLVKFAAK